MCKGGCLGITGESKSGSSRRAAISRNCGNSRFAAGVAGHAPSPLPLPGGVGRGRAATSPARSRFRCDCFVLGLVVGFIAVRFVVAVLSFLGSRSSEHRVGFERKLAREQESRFMVQFWKWVHSRRPVRQSRRLRPGTSNGIRWSWY